MADTIALAKAPPVDGPQRIRVLVAHSEELVIHGFRLILAGQSWSERCVPARDAAQAVDFARRFQPHVAIVDPNLAADPAAWQCELRLASPRTRLLLLTETEATLMSAVTAFGAVGCVSRRLSSDQLLDAIRQVATGRPLPSDTASRSPLSARQEEILQLLAHGQTNVEIADHLYLSRHTVKQHTSALYRKLNARNRTQAVQTGQRLGLIAS